MRLFQFHKQHKEHKLSWEDISLKQYLQLQKLDANSDTFIFDLMAVIYGEKVLSLSIKDFKALIAEKAGDLTFLKSEPEIRLPKKVYEINGHRYELNLKKLITAQYIDYQNLMKRANLPADLPRLLSIFLLKEGCEYGEYDLDDQLKDMEDMSIVDVLSIAFFFEISLHVFINHFKSSSTQKLKKLKLPKEEKQKLIESNNRMINSAFSPL